MKKLMAIVVSALCAAFVVHAETYRVSAAGGGNGLSWESPMSLADGIAAVAANGGELWLKGEVFALAEDIPALTPAAGEVTIRGGFAGMEETPEERTPGVKTTIDGQDLYRTFRVTCNKVVTLERIIFTRSNVNGIYKDGSSTFTVRECEMTHNGRVNYPAKVQGRGAYVTAGNNYFTNCVVYANWGETQVDYIGTAGIEAEKCTLIRIDGTTFERNGYAGVGRWSPCSTINATQSKLIMNDCVFRGNRVVADNGQGLVYLFQNGTGSRISKCLFVGNEQVGTGGSQGIIYVNYSFGVANTVEIEGCTFAYNVGASSSGAVGVAVNTGTATVKNCIFWGNLAGSGLTSGTDVTVVGANGICNLSYSLFGGSKDTKADYYRASAGTLNEGEGIVFGDSKFVSTLADFQALLTDPTLVPPKASVASPAFTSFLKDDAQFAKVKALDVHLRSSRGYYTNDGVLHENEGDATSLAIDKGDPEQSVGDEPEPNGGLLNLGFYGGTAEASMTAASEPAVDSVAVTFEGEYSQPTVTFTLGGTGAYSADAVVSVSTNGTDWCFVSAPIPGLEKGMTKVFLVPDYYLAGGTIIAKVAISAGSSGAEKASEETEITGSLPPWAGKGGNPARVIHVRPGATCRQDGTSWSDAYLTLDEAFSAVTDERNEIWVAGAFKWTGGRTAFSFTKAFSLRGGFEGTENAASERADGTLTVIDGNEQADGLAFANSAAVSLERFRFTNGKAHGLDRTERSGMGLTGTGDLTVSNCEFVANGHYSSQDTSANAQGGGACFADSGASRLRLVDCLFEENTKTNNGVNPITWPFCGQGAGAYVSGFKQATLEGCRFVRNGICNDAKGFRSAGARALHIAGTPVTLVGCEFRGNGGNTWQGCGPIVNLSGACGGSAFTNCLWAGNNEGNGTDAGQGNAALAVSLDTVDAPVDLVNCTFAYNVADATEKPAGLHVVKGAAKVRNCIFWGNAVGDLAKVGADIHTATNGDASAEVAYTLFGGEGENWASGSNELANCTFGDPRFVTTLTDFTNTASKVTAGVPGRTALPSIKPASLVAASAFDVHARKRSPAIDAGDPANAWENEPSPNGQRINLGFYGNTSEAALSSAGLIILLK